MGKTLFEKIFFILYAALFSCILVVCISLIACIFASLLSYENLFLIVISERYFSIILKFLSFISIIVWGTIMLLIFPDYLKDEDNKKDNKNKEEKEVD